jgi:hypothetical protein
MVSDSYSFDTDPYPDLIRIQGFYGQKVKHFTAEKNKFLIKNLQLSKENIQYLKN